MAILIHEKLQLHQELLLPPNTFLFFFFLNETALVKEYLPWGGLGSGWRELFQTDSCKVLTFQL